MNTQIPGYIKIGDGTTSVAASHLTNGNYALTCRKLDEQFPVGTRLPVEKYSGPQFCIEVTNSKAAMVLLQCAASIYHLMEVHERARAGEDLMGFAQSSTVAGHPPKASL